MKYIIYELVTAEGFSRIDTEGYSPRVINRSIMEKLDVYGVQEEHDSMDKAIQEIQTHKEKLKYKSLTIMPVLEINWEGEVR